MYLTTTRRAKPNTHVPGQVIFSTFFTLCGRQQVCVVSTDCVFGTTVEASRQILRLTSIEEGAYSQGMRKGRAISTLVIAVILILRGGDCVPLLFANQQTKECCTKGNCSRSQKACPCCQTSSSDSVQHFQAQERVPLPTLADVDSFAVEAFSSSLLPVLYFEPIPIDTSPPFLPGPITRVSLPLLI